MVERTLIRPPGSRLGPVTPEERREVISKSPVGSRYDKVVDRESAHEILARRAEDAAQVAAREKQARSTPVTRAPRGSGRQSSTEAFTKSVVRSIGYAVGRAVVRGVLGSLSKGK